MSPSLTHGCYMDAPFESDVFTTMRTPEFVCATLVVLCFGSGVCETRVVWGMVSLVPLR